MEDVESGWNLDGDRISFRAPCARACGRAVEGSLTIAEAISLLSGGREPPRGVQVAVKQALRMGEAAQGGEGEGPELPVDGGLVCADCLGTPLADDTTEGEDHG